MKCREQKYEESTKGNYTSLSYVDNVKMCIIFSIFFSIIVSEGVINSISFDLIKDEDIL